MTRTADPTFLILMHDSIRFDSQKAELGKCLGFPRIGVITWFQVSSRTSATERGADHLNRWPWPEYTVLYINVYISTSEFGKVPRACSRDRGSRVRTPRQRVCRCPTLSTLFLKWRESSRLIDTPPATLRLTLSLSHSSLHWSWKFYGSRVPHPLRTPQYASSTSARIGLIYCVSCHTRFTHSRARLVAPRQPITS